MSKLRAIGNGREQVAAALRSFVRKAERLDRDDRGSVAMIAAVAFPVLIGGIGLGAEAGAWYMEQRQLQHAADLSAFSAAARLKQGDSKATLDAVALHIATESGFNLAKGTIQVNNPPASGPNAGDNTKVEVILSENIDRVFTSFFQSGTVGVSGRAVGAVVGSKICSLALSATASSALLVKASADVVFENCVVASNSGASTAFHTQGSGSFKGDCVYTVGGFQTGGSSSATLTVCGTVQSYTPPTPDPYSNATAPTAPTPCVAGNIGSNNVYTTVTPTLTLANGVNYIHYCSLSTSGHVTFEPGVYIIDGDFSSSGQSITSNGATFVVGGNVSLAGGSVLKLTAPTSGPYSGLVFFGDRDATAETAKVTGSSGSVIQGAVYFPTGDLEYTGSSAATNGCTQIIANTITFTGNSGVRSSCSGSGTRQFQLSQMAKLVE